jgi:aminopeptidase N
MISMHWLLTALTLVSLQATFRGGSTDTPSGTIEHYAIVLDLDPAAEDAKVDTTLTLKAGAKGRVTLDLDDAVEVVAVTANGRSMVPQREPGRLIVELGSRPANRPTIIVNTRVRSTEDGLRFGRGADSEWFAETYGLPFSAAHWFPCVDSPKAKAKGATIRVSVPPEFTVASNGRLIKVSVQQDGRRTFYWRTSYPIYPDVIAVHAARFSRISRTYVSPAGYRMPLEYFVPPADAAGAMPTLAAVPEILSTFERLFGPYPFRNEKYGVVALFRDSFREHQTLTALGPRYLAGDPPRLDILAHEIAHHWFGDGVSVADWHHVWLNEGLATYAVALWREAREGSAGYDEQMRDFTAKAASASGPLVLSQGAPRDQYFTANTFYRGAVVMHMLREQVGRELFLKALRAYLNEHMFQSASTGDLQRAFEQTTGRTLSEFFSRYVYSR